MLNNLTIKTASKLLETKKVSSLELTKFYLNNIKKNNKNLNSFISVLESEALDSAKHADKRILAGKKLGVLDGIPMSLKDNMSLAGSITTAGSKMLENYKAPYDATVTKKLKEAGVVILGKNNMDEFAMGSSTESSYFGNARNPHDSERVPGGSSGGSAIATVSDQVVFSLGSDTGGSIRQPASFCGAVGLKPTYGAVSRYGLLAMASSLDQIGPFSKNVEDAAILLDAISGHDPKDATSIPNFPKVGNSYKKDIKGLKIGVPKEALGGGVNKKIEECFRDAIFKLEKAGAKVVEVSLPLTEYAVPCYYIIVPAEVSSNMGRYDGIKYGLNESKSKNEKVKNLIELYEENRAEGFGDEVKRRIMLGSYVLSAGYYDAYYKKAQKVRALIKQEYENIFKKVDVLATPTAPNLPFKFGEKSADPLAMYLEDIFTIPANLAGLPAVSVPCGMVAPEDGDKELPIGIQFIGPQMGESKILQAAYNLEKII